MEGMYMVETQLPAGKPGYKTTEFWLTVAVDALGALMGSGAFDGASENNLWLRGIGVAVMVLGTLGYAAARTFTKRAG